MEFPGISHNEDYLLSGVDFHASSGDIYVSANARAAFFTNGANLTGPNKLIRYDPRTKSVVWITDLAGIIQEIEQRLGQAIGGFQDQAEDLVGNTYYMSTWGNVLIKVDRFGRPAPFYIPSKAVFNDSIPGFGGLFIRGNRLVVSDSISKSFMVFDLHGLSQDVFHVFPTNVPRNYTPLLCDSLYAPSKYHGRIALCADDFAQGIGGIVAYRSTDFWRTAEYLGILWNDHVEAPNGTATATFEAGDSIYAVVGYLPGNDGSPRRASSFPIIDITGKVAELVGL